MKRIAIQPDRLKTDHGIQSFSDRWIDHLARSPDHEARVVDIHRAGSTREVVDCDAFMWRWRGAVQARSARRIIPALEFGLGIPTFPSTNVALLTRDKVYQQMLLEGVALPCPGTWSFFKAGDALDFARTASYPLVIKMSGSLGSRGVGLIRDFSEAEAYIDEVFRFGITDVHQATGSSARRTLRHAWQAARFVMGRQRTIKREGETVYFQEFVPGNDFDTRVTIIGRYATAFRRMNRENDFRASGSGRIDWDPSAIDAATIRFAFEVSRTLDLPFIAIDILFQDSSPLVCELNFAYLAWAVARCPRHWFMEDPHDPDSLVWRDGPIDPELLTLTEFLRIHAL
jgi:glutathione synthase/RimK-type ligase-like ATP-grasp enzyme